MSTIELCKLVEYEVDGIQGRRYRLVVGRSLKHWSADEQDSPAGRRACRRVSERTDWQVGGRRMGGQWT